MFRQISNRQALLFLLLAMLSFFWLLNAAEKSYSLFNKPAFEETILGTQEYLGDLNSEEKISNYTIINGKWVAKDFFRNPSRWHQVRKWWLRSVDSQPLVDTLSFYTLLAGAIFETAILLVFLLALANTVVYKKFDHHNYQLGILLGIVLFTSLYFFDALLDGNRLELFEHQVYIGMQVIFYFVSCIDLHLKKLQVMISGWTKSPTFLLSNGFNSSVLKKALVVLFFASSFVASAQQADVKTFNKFEFNGDFRFRVEQDWNSLKADGSKRENRLRLRQRFRFGFTKSLNEKFSVGMQLRTGRLDEPQGPHVTLGNKHGILPIGLEKAFLKYKANNMFLVIGKHSYPFFKQNDVFWGDNVFPDGLTAGFSLDKNNISVKPKVAYYVYQFHSQSGLRNSSQILSYQSHLAFFKNQKASVEFNTGMMHLINMPYLEYDGDFNINYHILLSSVKLNLNRTSHQLNLGIDNYYNLESYNQFTEIDNRLINEKSGTVLSLKYRNTNFNKWSFDFYLASIGQFSLVPYLAQNDWGRWSSNTNTNLNSSRLTNFRGAEVRLSHALTKKVNLQARYYSIQSKVQLGEKKETGQRLRFDINAKF